MILTLETVKIKFESGQKEIPFTDLLTFELETEKRYRLPETSGREIYFHGVTLNPGSKCAGNFQHLITHLKTANAPTIRMVSKAMHKDPYQRESNILQIRSFTNLHNMDDLEIEVIRTQDINSKCDNKTPEKFILHYYIA